ncbi:PaaI family thioesterase [Sphingomonas sinipercae]|uniref:PaaI family thioesterase n=1 Tax=Sphingomonas sinipercae TaxID=2714944 RepID=A0A6G7ZMD7_9SPHN|nr:PaaI family thioesterase [Sphingomonas sinipercae]QIL02079.1 PaaI family thioesterase [Sphingomonas sinipercae]
MLGYVAQVQDRPPYAELLNVEVERGDGEIIVNMPFADDVVGRPGFLHGGAIAGLLEIAAFTALREKLANDSVRMKPVTVTVDYMRPGSGHPTRASAHVQRLGTNIANVEAFAWQKDRDEPIATARINFLLERGPDA